MKTQRFNTRSIMNLAWQFIKKYGYTLSEALKCAWANAKFCFKAQSKIVHFLFQKIDGTMREAYGTLNDAIIPETGGRRSADSVQTYFDTEKNEWRCFKKQNLVKIY